MLPDVPITEEEAQLMADTDEGTAPPEPSETGAIELLAALRVWPLPGGSERESLEALRSALLAGGCTAPRAGVSPQPGITRDEAIDALNQSIVEQGYGGTDIDPGDLLDALIEASGWALLADGATPADPEPAEGEDVMPRVQGKPFRCECGGNVFTRTGSVYRCNSCPREYEGIPVGATPAEDDHRPRDVGDELIDALGDARIVVWFCPTDHSHRVEWTTHDDKSMTPRCLDCDQVGPTRAGGASPEGGRDG